MYKLTLVLAVSCLIIIAFCALFTGMFLYKCKGCGRRFTYVHEEVTSDLSGHSKRMYLRRTLRCFNPRCRREEVMVGISVG